MGFLFQHAHLNPQLQLSGQQQQSPATSGQNPVASGQISGGPSSSLLGGLDAEERRERESNDDFIEIKVRSSSILFLSILDLMLFIIVIFKPFGKFCLESNFLPHLCHTSLFSHMLHKISVYPTNVKNLFELELSFAMLSAGILHLVTN